MRPPSTREFSDLVLHLYQAAQRPALWFEFLDRLVQVTGSDGAALLMHDLRSGAAEGATSGYDAAEVRRYHQHYSAINPWVPKSRADDRGTKITRGEDVLPAAKLRQTEYYNDWGKRNSTFHTMAVNLGLDDRRLTYLSIGRAEKRRPYPAEVDTLLNLLIPHLEQSVQIQKVIDVGRQLGFALDSLTLAVFALDASGRVAHLSRRARQLTEAQDGLLLDARGRLHPAHLQDKPAFDRLFTTQPGQCAMRLRRAKQGPDHVLVMLPRRQVDSVFEAGGGFIALLLEREVDSPQSLESAVAPLFGLTKAEARLASVLAETGSLESAHERLRVSRNTAKSQMAAIFRKTGTHRQAEVIRLLHSLTTVITQTGDDNR